MFCRSVRLRNDFGEMDNCLASLLLFVEIKQKSQEKKSQNLGSLMKQIVEMDKQDKTGTHYNYFLFCFRIVFDGTRIALITISLDNRQKLHNFVTSEPIEL